MKKIIPCIIVGMMIIGAFGVGGIPSQPLKKETITITFSSPSIETTQTYTTINFKETNTVLLQPNYPVIPCYVHTFTFPFGTKIKNVYCKVTSVRQLPLTKELQRAPQPVLQGITSSMKQSKSTFSSATSISEPYPTSWYTYKVGSGIEGEDRCVFVNVHLYPIRYMPSQQTIEMADEITVDVLYEQPDTQMPTLNDEYKFIILTPSEYSSALQSLVNHKISRGISTKLVTLSEIYGGTYFPVEGRDNPEQIKYFIKNAIENWGTTSVLLVGGSDQFPTRETHVYVDYGDGDDEIFASDLYYADIYQDDGGFCSWDSNDNDVFGEYRWGSSKLTDEVDLYPDVHLGRLACTNEADVTNCVNKIITYENTKAYAQDWFTNLVVIGGDTSPHDEDNVDEGEVVNQAIIDIMEGFIPDKIWDSNGRLSGISPTGVQNINNGFNNGCGFVDFSGHGSTKVWTTYPHNGSRQTLPTPWGAYYNYQVLELENGDKLPIVVTGACSVAKFIQNSECFTWSFVASHTGGGIGSFGPSSLSWGYTGLWCVKGLGGKMQVSLFDAYKNEGAITFGEMWTRALNSYISSAGMDCGDHKTVEQWQPFGDPTLAIAEDSLAPEKPVITGPTTGTVGVEYTYNASTTDPDGDDVYYLFDWGDGEYSEWFGPYDSGELVQATHTWAEKGSYEIRVLAKDDHGVQSEWSDPLPVSMPKVKPYVSWVNMLLGSLFERVPGLGLLLHL